MGTRADFYIQNPETKELNWLGSIGWDGYPSGIINFLLESKSEEEFKANLTEFFKHRNDVTLPDMGWPWPWEDSRTTDYSYIFMDGKVMASCFGYPLFDPLLEEEERSEDETKLDIFPDMTDRKNVTFGQRSGVILFGA